MGLDQEEFNQIFLTALGNDAVVKKLQTVLCSELHKEITLMHNMIKSKDEKIAQLENKVEILENRKEGKCSSWNTCLPPTGACPGFLKGGVQYLLVP